MFIFVTKVDDGKPDSPIDLPAVRQAYALIWTLKPLDVFLSTMTNALEILLMSLDTTSIQADEINEVSFCKNDDNHIRGAGLHQK